MSVKFTMKLGALQKFSRAIEKMPRALDQASAELATEAVRLADESFGRRQDPHGAPWRPRVDRLPHPLLEKTGALRGSMRGVPLRRGFRLTFGTKYGKYHQSGTSRMPRRAIVPFRGLPGRWRTRLAAVLRRSLRAHLRGV